MASVHSPPLLALPPQCDMWLVLVIQRPPSPHKEIINLASPSSFVSFFMLPLSASSYSLAPLLDVTVVRILHTFHGHKILLTPIHNTSATSYKTYEVKGYTMKGFITILTATFTNQAHFYSMVTVTLLPWSSSDLMSQRTRPAPPASLRCSPLSSLSEHAQQLPSRRLPWWSRSHKLFLDSNSSLLFSLALIVADLS